MSVEDARQISLSSSDIPEKKQIWFTESHNKGVISITGLPAPRHEATGKGGGLGSGVPATIENLSLAGTSPSRVTGMGGVLLRIRRPTTIEQDQ